VTADIVVLPDYRGHVDTVEPAVSGWVAEISRPGVPVAFELAIDGAERLAAIADRPRPDVAAAGLGAANCGFSVALPDRLFDGEEHRLALLLPDGRSLDLPGHGLRIALGPVASDLIASGAASVGAVVDLLRRTDAEGGFDPDLIGLDHAAAFNAIAAPEQGFVFYARAGGRLVGYSRLDRGRGDGARLGVVSLTVIEAYRRKGIGEKLLRALLCAGAAERGLAELWLSVRPDNAPALRLYEKLGFVYETDHPAGRWAVPGELTMRWLPHGAGPS